MNRLPPLKPRPFQEAAISRGVDQNILIADEPGLGKTLDGVEIARRVSEEFRKPGRTSYLLVVARSTLHAQWVETILRQDITEVEDKLIIVDTKTRTLPPGGGVRRYWVITTYDALIRLPGFTQVNWTCVVADEVHKIRNVKAQRTKALWALKTIRCVGLTGTEKDKHPGELWSYLHWFDREQFRHLGPWMKRFVQYKTVYGRDQTWEVPVGTKKGVEAELQQVMSQWMLKRSKLEVAPDLPPLIEQVVNLGMTRDQELLYHRIERTRDAIVEVGDLGLDGDMGMGVLLIENAMTKFIRLQQVLVDPGLLKSPGQSCKLTDLEEWLEENPDEQFVVFTKFRDTAQKVAARFETDLVMGGVQYGPDGPAARFKAGAIRGVSGTIASMSEGLNLQAAKTIIFLDQSWSSIDMRQAKDRVHRMDIVEPKYIRYLHCAGTVDDDVLEAQANKWTDNQLLAHLQAKDVV